MTNLNPGSESAKAFYNAEAAKIVDALDTFIVDVSAMPAANRDNVDKSTLEIIAQNWQMIVDLYNEVKADPELYMPNVDETPVDVGPAPAPITPENTTLAYFSRLALRLRMQLRNGKTKEQVTGINTNEDKWVFAPLLVKVSQDIQNAQARVNAGQTFYFADVDNQSAVDNEPGHPA